jgi:hypothetical protein
MRLDHLGHNRYMINGPTCVTPIGCTAAVGIVMGAIAVDTIAVGAGVRSCSASRDRALARKFGFTSHVHSPANVSCDSPGLAPGEEL